MNQITPYLHKQENVRWPVQLFSMYQRPTGMIGWGIHDTVSAEALQAQLKSLTADRDRGKAGTPG